MEINENTEANAHESVASSNMEGAAAASNENALQQEAPFVPNPDFGTEYVNNPGGFNCIVDIGPNQTSMPADEYAAIDWKLPTDAIHRLLLGVFGSETLATHALSGKPLPAYRNPKRLLKDKLDPLKVGDIIFMVHGMTGVSEKMIRKEITKKCLEECKLLRERFEREYVDEEE